MKSESQSPSMNPVTAATSSGATGSAPGKPQEGLDFSYFGGIYRDVYLISTGPVYITDPNEANTCLLYTSRCV